jgi:ABC-type uncharacterized transport system ATPase subunit
MTEIRLETRALSRHFGALIAVNEIDFKLNAGARHALIGPNGGARSTFQCGWRMWREKVDQHNTGSVQYERIERVIVEHTSDNAARSLPDTKAESRKLLSASRNRPGGMRRAADLSCKQCSFS